MIEHEISWENCVDVCTDGARAMAGKSARVGERIKELTPSYSNTVRSVDKRLSPKRWEETEKPCWMMQ
jgi:hypothetical protein